MIEEPRSSKIVKVKGKHGGARISTKPRCGAVTRGTDVTRGKFRDGHPCLRVAGHGTNHLGSGRCKYHGGSSPIRHGLYSKVVPNEMKASYLAALADQDPRSMREHLALLDGVILPAALARGENQPLIAGQSDPLQIQLQAIETRSKVVRRLAAIEQSGKIAFTPAELRMLIVQIVSVVAEFVDATTLKKIATRIGTQSLSVLSEETVRDA